MNAHVNGSAKTIKIKRMDLIKISSKNVSLYIIFIGILQFNLALIRLCYLACELELVELVTCYCNGCLDGLPAALWRLKTIQVL